MHSTCRTGVYCRLEASAGHSLEWWLVTLVHRNIQVAANSIGCIRCDKAFGRWHVTRVLALLLFLWKEKQNFFSMTRKCQKKLLSNSSIIPQKWHLSKHFSNAIYANRDSKLERFSACSRWWSLLCLLNFHGGEYFN